MDISIDLVMNSKDQDVLKSVLVALKCQLGADADHDTHLDLFFNKQDSELVVERLIRIAGSDLSELITYRCLYCLGAIASGSDRYTGAVVTEKMFRVLMTGLQSN